MCRLGLRLLLITAIGIHIVSFLVMEKWFSKVYLIRKDNVFDNHGIPTRWNPHNLTQVLEHGPSKMKTSIRDNSNVTKIAILRQFKSKKNRNFDSFKNRTGKIRLLLGV